MHASNRCACVHLKARKFVFDKMFIRASSPFKKVNVHGVELLDVGKVQQICEQKGKDVCPRIQVRVCLMQLNLRIRMFICASI